MCVSMHASCTSIVASATVLHIANYDLNNCSMHTTICMLHPHIHLLNNYGGYIQFV